MEEHQAAERDVAGQEKAAAAEIPASRSANQAGEQPVPASHDDEPRQEAVVRNEQFAAESAPDEPRGSRDDPSRARQGE
jgi:hypothetical protein